MLSTYTDIFEKIQSILTEHLEINKEITPDLQVFYHETIFYMGFSNISSSPPSNWGEFFANGGKSETQINLYNGDSALDLLFSLEEEFDIEISDDAFSEMQTVKDIVSYLLQEIHGINLKEIESLEKARKENRLF